MVNKWVYAERGGNVYLYMQYIFRYIYIYIHVYVCTYTSRLAGARCTATRRGAAYRIVFKLWATSRARGEQFAKTTVLQSRLHPISKTSFIKRVSLDRRYGTCDSAPAPGREAFVPGRKEGKKQRMQGKGVDRPRTDGTMAVRNT
jgi:hypothetical protein